MDRAMTSGEQAGFEDRPDLITEAGVIDGVEASAGRGTLRTYLGIAPGVGKTYAMLRDGRARRRGGADVVVAYWERPGRSATAAHPGGLEVLPPAPAPSRGG